MIDTLRKVLPQKLLSFEDKYKKHDDLSKNCEKYGDIVEICDKVLKVHLFIQNWMEKFERYGDCWNISSICAEFLHFKGLTPHLFSFRGGGFIYHLECADYKAQNFRYWYVTPHNELGHFTFSNTGWIPQEIWELSWFLVEQMRYRVSCKFSYHGPVEDGLNVRKLIHEIHPDYRTPVILLDLIKVRECFNLDYYTEI